MNKIVFFLITVVIVASCSKNKRILDEDDLRKSTDYISGEWYYYEKYADVDHTIAVSLPNKSGEMVFHYYAKADDSDKYLTEYKGIINSNSFIKTRKNGKSVIEIKAIRFLGLGYEHIGASFYIINESNYRPGYQLRTNRIDMYLTKGFFKYTQPKGNVFFFEYEYALEMWGKNKTN